MAIKIGDGATYHIGSDRYPYTVVQIVSPKKIHLKPDHYERIDNNGISENQEYKYIPNPNAQSIVVSLRKDGRWRRQGESLKAGFYSFNQGRNAYQDPSY